MTTIPVKIFDGHSAKPQTGEITLLSKTHFHLVFEGHDAQHQWTDTSLSITGKSWTIRLFRSNHEIEIAIQNPKQYFHRGRPPMTRGSINARATSIAWGWWVLAGLGSILGLAAFYIFWLPNIVYGIVDQLPTSLDEDISSLNPIVPFMKNEENSAASMLLYEYLETIDMGSERQIYPIVVNSPISNAFAMPNGDVVVFSSIIQEMESHEALTGLLAHEAGHVEFRHGIKSLAYATTGVSLMSLLMGDISSFTAILMDNAHQLNQLSYSREFERESDAFALDVLRRNQMSSAPLQALFEGFDYHTDDESVSILRESDIFMSHPDPSERIDALHSDHYVLPDSAQVQRQRQKIFDKILAALDTVQFNTYEYSPW